MENVWDYPRPPAVERCERRVRVVVDGETIVDTDRALRVLETSHPPVIYIPVHDFRAGVLVPVPKRTFCEFKGRAAYFDVAGRREAGWHYPEPAPGFKALRGHVAVYPGRMDQCLLDDEVVTPQESDFYGGWITADIEGPFKGDRWTGRDRAAIHAAMRRAG